MLAFYSKVLRFRRQMMTASTTIASTPAITRIVVVSIFLRSSVAQMRRPRRLERR